MSARPRPFRLVVRGLLLLLWVSALNPAAMGQALFPFPRTLSTFHQDAEFRGLAADGARVLAAGAEQGVWLLELRPDRSLEVLAHLPLSGECLAVALRGNTGYVARGADGVTVLDLTDPVTPAIAAELDTVRADSIILSGTALIAAGADGSVTRIDAADPAAPWVREQVSTGHSGPVRLRHTATGLLLAAGAAGVFHLGDADGPFAVAPLVPAGFALDVAVDGALLAVADDRDGLAVWNLAGAAPELIDAFPGDRSAVAVWSRGKLASLGGELTFRQAASPATVTAQVFYQGACLDMATAAGAWVLALGPEGLLVVDPSEGLGPVSVNYPVIRPTDRYHEAVRHQNNIVVAADRGGLLILDNADPSIERGRLLQNGFAPRNLTLRQDTVFAGVPEAGFLIADLAGGATPAELGRLWAFSGGAHRIALRGDYAYVCAGEFGLRTVDIRDPHNPIVVDDLLLSHITADFVIGATHAYQAGRYRGFRPFYLGIPERPIAVALVQTRNAYSLALQGDRLYVADSNKGLRIYDVSEPGDPVELSRSPSVFATQVLVDGDLAVTLNRAEGLRFFDVANPSSPVHLGDCLGGPALVRMTLDAESDRLLVAALDGGLWEVRLHRRPVTGLPSNDWRRYR